MLNPKSQKNGGRMTAPSPTKPNRLLRSARRSSAGWAAAALYSAIHVLFAASAAWISGSPGGTILRPVFSISVASLRAAVKRSPPNRSWNAAAVVGSGKQTSRIPFRRAALPVRRSAGLPSTMPIVDRIETHDLGGPLRARRGGTSLAPWRWPFVGNETDLHTGGSDEALNTHDAFSPRNSRPALWPSVRPGS